MRQISAGLIMYRVKERGLEILLVHPGGPFWKNKDEGGWSIPKGQVDEGESVDNLLEVAQREFREETGFEPKPPYIFVGVARRESDGKTVDAWAFEDDCDPTKITSNMITIHWPPKSGKEIVIPEIDKGAFFTLEEARKKLHPYLLPILDAFEKVIKV